MAAPGGASYELQRVDIAGARQKQMRVVRGGRLMTMTSAGNASSRRIESTPARSGACFVMRTLSRSDSGNQCRRISRDVADPCRRCASSKCASLGLRRPPSHDAGVTSVVENEQLYEHPAEHSGVDFCAETRCFQLSMMIRSRRRNRTTRRARTSKRGCDHASCTDRRQRQRAQRITRIGGSRRQPSSRGRRARPATEPRFIAAGRPGIRLRARSGRFPASRGLARSWSAVAAHAR